MTMMTISVTRNWDVLGCFDVTDDVIAELSHEYHLVVNKVRAVVKRSQTKNDENLQPCVKRELGKKHVFDARLQNTMEQFGGHVEPIPAVTWTSPEGTH